MLYVTIHIPIVIATMISMEYIYWYIVSKYHYIILLYSLLVFIIDNKIVTVNVIDENIQIDFINDDITVGIGVQVIPII